jgi:sugar phosphate isomerase/epimerase
VPVVPLAVQLWSVREAAQHDLAGALERIAACGYDAVEPFDLHGHSAARFGRELRARGLSVVGFHLQWASSLELAAALDDLQELGAGRLIVPWWDPAQLRTVADVARLAERLNALREPLARRGLELGYHNHAFEFARRLEGRPLHELLFEQLHPEIFAEIDIYWAAVGGADPARVLRALGPRARLVHLKDGPADGEESLMTALGEGRLDLPAVAEASAHCAAHIVEIDACAGDVFDALARSRSYWLQLTRPAAHF